MTKQQQCEHAKAAYASELQKTNRDQQQHYNFLMPDVFKVGLQLCDLIWPEKSEKNPVVNVALLLHTGLGLALSRVKQWRSCIL